MSNEDDSGFRDLKTGRPMTVQEVQARFSEHEERDIRHRQVEGFLFSIGLIIFGSYLQYSNNIFISYQSAIFTPIFGLSQIVIGVFGLFILLWPRKKRV
jgi:hypothetical protein